MIILGLDTTGAHCTASLVKDGAALAGKSEEIGRGHAERLAPMVQEIITAANIEPTEVKQIAVCTGPGSFTGLRVALAFAKGFALPRTLPVIGLSALECLAVQSDPHKKLRVASILNVRRGQVCWAVYDRGEELAGPTTHDISVAQELIKAFRCDVYAGDGTTLLGAMKPCETIVDGQSLALLSAGRLPIDYPAVPLYSRGPDAKLPGGRSP